jgi:hypothetical protein
MSIPGIILLIAAALFIYLFNGLVIKRSRVENFYLYYKAFLKRRMEYLEDLLAMLPDEADPLQIKVKDLLEKHCLNSNIVEQSQWDCALTEAWKELFESIKDNVELKDILNRLERNGGYLVSSRREYNQAVKNLNSAIAVFPWSLLARCMKITPRTACTLPESEWYKPLALTSIKD